MKTTRKSGLHSSRRPLTCSGSTRAVRTARSSPTCCRWRARFPTSKKAWEFVGKYGDAGYGIQKSEVEVLPLLVTNTPDGVGHPSFTYTLETK